VASVLIYPAIDLMDGRAVRLVRGERETAHTVGDPLDLIAKFKPAPLVHVVDLDGAFAGMPKQLTLIGKLASLHAVQVGGGIRTASDIQALFDAGVQRVVLGTIAVTSPQLLDEALAKHGPERIVVAVDVKDGHVAVSGWEKTAALAPRPFCASLATRGVQWILCTAVHKDGTMEGPALDVLDDLQAADARLKIIASGGIGELADVRKCKHLAAVIVGKALYARRFTLEEALAC
jgi:phosphoribosylformimino-5-aminoimidazole carboxamide ribotide isomerase